MNKIQKSTYYRLAHVTGPGCVLVSLRFGTTPDNGPCVVLRGVRGDLAAPSFDVEEYVSEVLSGVEEANTEFSGSLQVAEIEIVPDDYPRPGQVRVCSTRIAKHVLEEE